MSRPKPTQPLLRAIAIEKRAIVLISAAHVLAYMLPVLARSLCFAGTREQQSGPVMYM
jgi:hypothetical protein